MSKGKPKKCVLRRVKITGSGKIKHKRMGTSHRMKSFTGKRKRKLRTPQYVPASEAPKIAKALGIRVTGR